MNLNEQVQILCQEAPNYGVPRQVMEKAIAPVLIELAQSLQQSSYFVLQTRDRAWQTTTLSHRNHPTQRKTVIYAFARREHTRHFPDIATANLDLSEIPVIDLLFQLFALEQVDSLIFLDNRGNQEKSKEIQRQALQQRVEQNLRSLSPSPQPSSVPSTWA